ncbi:prostaglandin reductase 1-like [Eriocheir sinensis]|uniref:prostaglandin reductase 1-like n=1 Tax=Eriocheir sinensis TaxID=95602 RepID=UPI0021C774A2|nr:prostaglandin reductase 1-like [Eriocheir sinensis]XP_050731585.1 prostaglandin reductase 1-like [Eriocheir sinensis]
MVTAKVWQLLRRPTGEPTREDFTCVEETLPPCADGDVLVVAESLSVDPYMRYLLRTIPLNTTVVGEQLARVTESKNSEWPVGSYMLVSMGWRTHSHLTAADLRDSTKNVQRLPDFGKLPRSTALGILGMPGNTAYLAFIEVMKPKVGETVLVNGAAGAVGSIVVQLAKLAGCKVVAFAGSEEKVEWLKELGVDHAFNYKTVEVGDALAQAAPEKINIYFDNVGGKFTSEALPHMAEQGRVLVCGAISTYNTEDDIMDPGLNSPFSESLILWKQLTIKGFVIYRWKHLWEKSSKQMRKWVEEGKLQYRESIVQGFSNMPYTFIGIFHGSRTGKVVIMP